MKIINKYINILLQIHFTLSTQPTQTYNFVKIHLNYHLIMQIEKCKYERFNLIAVHTDNTNTSMNIILSNIDW